MPTCQNCGANLNGGEAHCPNCGAPQQAAPPQQAPYQQQPPPYRPPAYTQPAAPPPGSPYEPVSTGGFIGLMLLSMIPVVGFILMIVWAFSATKLSHRNWARANLLISVISIVLWVIVIAALGGIGGLMSYYNYAY